MTEFINGFRGDYYFLSNFFESPISIDYQGNTFVMSTGEHAFHAMKIAATDASTDHKIKFLADMQDALTPNKAKYLGRALTIDVSRWNAISYKCMQRVTELKYTQNLDLQEKLLQTAPAVLVEENTWSDRLWGTVNGVGLNQLGEILVNYRDALLEEKN